MLCSFNANSFCVTLHLFWSGSRAAGGPTDQPGHGVQLGAVQLSLLPTLSNAGPVAVPTLVCSIACNQPTMPVPDQLAAIERPGRDSSGDGTVRCAAGTHCFCRHVLTMLMVIPVSETFLIKLRTLAHLGRRLGAEARVPGRRAV